MRRAVAFCGSGNDWIVRPFLGRTDAGSLMTLRRLMFDEHLIKFDELVISCQNHVISCSQLHHCRFDTDHCRFFVVWAALISDARRSWRIFDLGSMAASRLPAIAWGHQRGYHVQRAESGCSHPGGTESLRFFPDVTPGFMPRCSALWQCNDSVGHWHKISISLNDVEWLTVGFWMCSTLCFSWQGWWPQWIVNCDSHNQFIFLRFLRGLNFNPSSCMTWDSWQARVRKATELEAPFGFGMALFRIYCIIWNACEHTHAYISISIYLFIYIYIYTCSLNIFICIHKISENQIDRFKNLLHVLTGNLEQIKQRIDQRGKEKLRRQKTYVDPLSFAYFLPSLLVSLFRFRFVIVLFLFFVFNMLHCSCF